MVDKLGVVFPRFGATWKAMTPILGLDKRFVKPFTLTSTNPKHPFTSQFQERVEKEKREERRFSSCCLTNLFRSLAVWRMMVGIVTLGDLIHRATEIHAHYSDEGVETRAGK